MAGTVLDELITIIGFRGDTRDLDRVQQRVKQVQSNINTMARNFGIAGAALTGVGFLVGRTILSFDRAMNTLRATFLDAPTEELLKLEKQAKDLGAETSKSATDAANAQVELARAGLDANQVMEAIPDVLNLAIAGELEMAEAAGLVTNQLAAFKLETSETERVVDVLAKTATSARTTVGELGPAFRQVAPLVAKLGVSIEQTAAIIGTLRSGGLIPEQTGTSLRNIVAVLQEEPTDRVREGFKNLGIEFEEVSAMVAAGDIEGAFKRIGDAGLDTKTALQIFGREAAVGASILAGSATDVEDFIAELEAAGGTADEMREILEGGFPGSVDQFKSALEGLQLSLADSGLRALMTNALVTLRHLINAISNAPGPIKTLIVAVIAAGPGLLVLSFGLKALAIAFRPLTTAIRTSWRLVTHWRASLRLLRMRVSRVTRSLRSFATAIWSRVSPALTALGRGVRAAGLAVRDFAVRLWTSGTAALGRFATSVRTNAIPALSRFAATIWASTIGALRALGRRLAMASLAVFRFALKAIVAGISGVIAFGVALWASLIPPLIAATAAVVGFTIALLANPVVLIVAAIIGAFVALGFVVYKFRRQILGALKTALAWVKGNWPLLVGILFGPFGIVGALIWKFRDDVVGAIMWIKDRVTSIFTSLRDFIIGIWEGLGEGLAGAFRGVINAVINGLNKALEVAAGLIEGIKGALDEIPGPNPAGDFLLGVASKLRAGIPNLAIGGIVPGPLGRPLLATVHGGEMVLPVGVSNVLAQMLEGFRLGPAALPQAPYHYGQMYRSSVVNRTVNINMNEPIVIQTQATDAKGIAQELGEMIQDQIRNVAYDHDGPVER